jgi:hypothetical protein
VLLLCSVMSAIPVPWKNFLESLDDLGTVACCEGCISEHKQAVPHSVFLQNWIKWSRFSSFLPNVVDDNGDLKIIYFTSYFQTVQS